MVHPYVLLNAKRSRFGYLVDASYDGIENVAVLTFLDPDTQTLFKWYDNTGHKSYLLTDAPFSEAIFAVAKSPEFLNVEEVTKYDAVLDEDVLLRKVYADNPLAIGGDSRRQRSFRNIFQEDGHRVWEAWIRYFSRYCYDNQFEVGMPYLVTDETVRPFIDVETETRIEKMLERLQTEHGVSYTDELHHWVKIFEHKLPTVKVVSLDIEVLPEDVNRMPNAYAAAQPVIAISFRSSTGKKTVFLLKRPNIPAGEEHIDAEEIKFFDDEKTLILETFQIINKHPFVVTFNGDVFDLMYLYNRATKLGIPKHANPIYVVRKQSKLKNSIHIDLYHFFNNNSIRVYAFKQKYTDYGLNDISKALLGKGKLDYKEGQDWVSVGDLTYMDLGRYCLQDAELTYELLTFKDNITLNLIFSLSKMANLPVAEFCRRKISDWIKSTFYYFLIKKNILIPSQEQLNSKGVAQTTLTSTSRFLTSRVFIPRRSRNGT